MLAIRHIYLHRRPAFALAQALAAVDLYSRQACRGGVQRRLHSVCSPLIAGLALANGDGCDAHVDGGALVLAIAAVTALAAAAAGGRGVEEVGGCEVYAAAAAAAGLGGEVREPEIVASQWGFGF